MNLCDDGHEEVCFEGSKCPACPLIDKIAAQEDELMQLRKEIIQLERERPV